MRRSQPSPEHAEAVSRRLATLSAELAAVRGEAGPAGPGDLPSSDEWAEPTRLRGSPVSPAPVVVPSPGRHAARRLTDRSGWPALQPAHLAVVAVLVAAALALAAWTAVRHQADPVAAPSLATAESPLAQVPSASETASGSPEPSGDVTVDVAGKVRRPGIAVLPAGSRVVDALEAAGGARRGVDLTGLNLARPLVDGEQVLVGVAAPAGVAGTLGGGGTGTAPPSGGLVNINSADQPALETLPGVGPVTAQSIIAWRIDNGGFSSVEELLEVDGIGEATLAKLAPLVTI